MALPSMERKQYKLGKYDIVAQPLLGSSHMLRYTVFVGGKLIGWYLTFGRHDWLVIGEFPDEKSAASAVLAAAAGGSLSDVETTLAMTAKDAVATFESAGKAARGFRSAGHA